MQKMQKEKERTLIEKMQNWEIWGKKEGNEETLTLREKKAINEERKRKNLFGS